MLVKWTSKMCPFHISKKTNLGTNYTLKNCINPALLCCKLLLNDSEKLRIKSKEPAYAHSPSPEPPPPPHLRKYTPYLEYWLPLAVTKTPPFLGLLRKSSQDYSPKIPPFPKKKGIHMRPHYAFEWGRAG